MSVERASGALIRCDHTDAAGARCTASLYTAHAQDRPEARARAATRGWDLALGDTDDGRDLCPKHR